MRLIRDGKGGEGVWRWGKRGIIYLSLHCHHQNDSCIKVGSDESHFNVPLIVRDKVTKTVSTDYNFGSERRAEADSNRGPSAYQPTALPPNRLTFWVLLEGSIYVSDGHQALWTVPHRAPSSASFFTSLPSNHHVVPC